VLLRKRSGPRWSAGGIVIFGVFIPGIGRSIAQDQQGRLKRRLRLESRRRIAAESQLEATQIEFEQAKANLAGERYFSDYLKEEWHCRDCNRRWGE